MKQIMRFPGAKAKAFTLSYDDGHYQDLRLMKIFDKNGLKATFNVSTAGLEFEPKRDKTFGKMHKDDLVAAFTNSNHEIAIHGYTHPHLEQLPKDQAMKEILTDRQTMEELFHKNIRGGAYPYGSFNDDVVEMLRLSGIKYFRTTVSTERFFIPQNWLTLPATCHHANPKLMELAKEFVDNSPFKQPSWKSESWLFYVWGHSHELDQGVPNNSWEMMEEFSAYIGGKDDIWYATNIEIFDYIDAYNRLEITLDESVMYNPTAMTLYFERDGKQWEIKSGETLIF